MQYISHMRPLTENDSPPGHPTPGAGALLATLARRVRQTRESLRLTRAELSRLSGVSVRFLARIESGEGNISIIRLEALARALGTTADRLVRRDPDGSSPIVLVGVRGAGKSTLGPRLAAELSLPFVEIDALIVESCGLELAQLFEIHGERYYRRMESEILQRLLGRSEPYVIAAAGGVVNEPETWDLLCARSRVVWLRAAAEDHWSRVIAQGDRRPMADNPGAMQELRAMLQAREPLYAQARLSIDTSRHSPEEAVEIIKRELAAGRAESTGKREV